MEEQRGRVAGADEAQLAVGRIISRQDRRAEIALVRTKTCTRSFKMPMKRVGESKSGRCSWHSDRSNIVYRAAATPCPLASATRMA